MDSTLRILLNQYAQLRTPELAIKFAEHSLRADDICSGDITVWLVTFTFTRDNSSFPLILTTEQNAIQSIAAEYLDAIDNHLDLDPSISTSASLRLGRKVYKELEALYEAGQYAEIITTCKERFGETGIFDVGLSFKLREVSIITVADTKSEPEQKRNPDGHMDANLRLLLVKYLRSRDPLIAAAFAEGIARQSVPEIELWLCDYFDGSEGGSTVEVFYTEKEAADDAIHWLEQSTTWRDSDGWPSTWTAERNTRFWELYNEGRYAAAIDLANDYFIPRGESINIYSQTLKVGK